MAQPLSTVYLSPKEFLDETTQEISGKHDVYDRLILSPAKAKPSIWAQDIWYDPIKIPIESISDGVRKLKKLGKYWSLFSIGQHRRAALIQEQLPKFKTQKLSFPDPLALPQIGGWTLLDANTILASPTRWKLAPHGEMEFSENKAIPPTRAYLKLWEALTLINQYPGKKDLCLDLGSSPGGWSWVLQSLGAEVISIDKAPLDPRINKLPRLTYLNESAFAIDPKRFGKINWLCCDVICYPDRLYKMIQRWLEAGTCENFICTVKLQGKPDLAILKKFQEIPGSQLMHLYQNKHELTWMKVPGSKFLNPE